MSSLPDDVLLRVLEMGTETCRLDHRDLCNLAMVNSKFNELSNDPSLWATLLSHDFPSSHHPSSEAPSKSLYNKKFEETKMAAPEARRYCWNDRTEDNGLGRKICRIPRVPPRFHHPRRTEGNGLGQKICRIPRLPPRFHHSGRIEGNGLGRKICLIPRLPPIIHHPVVSRVEYTINMKPLHDRITDQRTLQLEQFNRSCNIGPKPKAIPNSKYYVPLNKPRRQAMPRKI